MYGFSSFLMIAMYLLFLWRLRMSDDVLPGTSVHSCCSCLQASYKNMTWYIVKRRSQWSCGLRCRSAATCLLR